MSDYESDRHSDSDSRTAHWRSRRFDRHRRNRMNQVEGGSLFGQTVSRDSLYRAYQEASKFGGQAAGADGIKYADVSPGDVGEIMDWLSERLQEGTYRPQPTRRKPIPKPGSEEKRLLSIGSICDRAVAKSVNDMLAPLFETIFLDSSWGFRRGRGPLHMLADLEATMISQDRWVLAIADIRKAFDSVRIKDILKTHNELFERQLAKKIERGDRPRIWELVRTVLRGADSQRKLGIDQGNPYSPTALNVLLNLIHDVPLSEDVCFPSGHRYADNLTYLCHDVPEGHRVLDRVRHLLRSRSLELKEKTCVRDLASGDEAELMGFVLRSAERRLTLTIGKSAWDTLHEHLRSAHGKANPELTAKQVVSGWISNMGMAFETVESATERVLHIAADYGFRETWCRKELGQRVVTARRRWRRLRTAARGRHALGAPPPRISGFCQAEAGAVV